MVARRIADEPRPNFSDCTHCDLSDDRSRRRLPQGQVTRDGRETRPMAGEPIHPGDVTAGGPGSLARTDRLDGRSRLDGLVVCAPARLAEVDRSRRVRDRLRTRAVDFPYP